MGLGDKFKAVVKAAKVEAVMAKVNLDMKKAGYNPDDYAKFDTDEKKENPDADQ